LRPALATKEKNLDSFFTRAYGKRAKLEHDKYITELANLQSLQPAIAVALLLGTVLSTAVGVA
jgi:hypothetical protein